MRYNRLVENLNKRATNNKNFRRYNLSEIISESYKVIYNTPADSNIRKLAEAHLEDVRNNPTDIDRLSHQLCNLNYLASMVESKDMEDKELLVPEEKYSKVEPEEEDKLEESKHDEDVEETEDEDVIDEDTDLTDEEVEALTKHLSEIRKNKKVKESTSTKGRSLTKRVPESKTYESLDLSDFNRKSSSKAFVKTFKKLDAKLHEGTALTRQESISLYKAVNSAMTHLSVELEHNPEFLDTFKESTQLLSVDASKVLNSLASGKAPSKSTMKSLAKFSEALLREEEEEEEIPAIEDEEAEAIAEEEEEFDQEYAEARVELHKEIAEEHADDENPAVQEKIVQDAEEVAALPGTTEEQAEEILSDLPSEEPAEEEEPELEESAHDEDVEEKDDEDVIDEETQHDEDVEETEDEDLLDDSDITDEEMDELKKHLQEMRKAKQIKESSTKARRIVKSN